MPRFRCLACRRTFSQQSFACSYYLKRPELSVPIAAGLLAGSAHRQIARSLDCAPSTVTRRSARLGRHALLLSGRALRDLPVLMEPAVVDHFESFAISQDDPVGLATVVGHRIVVPVRHRSRRRIAAVDERRRPSGNEPLVAPLLLVVPMCVPSRASSICLAERLRVPLRPLDLITDDHPAYRIALDKHPKRRHFPQADLSVIHPAGRKAHHRSAEARRRDRAMFPADLLHGIMRHSCAHHRRETIAFSRRLNALLERAFLLVVWRNFIKARSERRSGEATPAMQLGITNQRWNWKRLLARRLFPSRIRVPAEWMRIYRRQWEVAAVPPSARHTLKLAY